MLAWCEQHLDRLAGLFAALGAIALFGLMTVTLTAVYARYVLNDPIFGIEDISTMSLTVIVAAAIAYGAPNHAHISVNVIRMVAGRRFTRVTDLLARTLGFLIVGFATYALFSKGSCGLPCGEMTNNLSIVHTPFYYVLAVAMGYYALVLLLYILIGLGHWKGEDPNEVAD